MTADIIDSMKVADLKTAPTKRNLPRNGLKSVTVTRLKEDVVNGMGSVKNFYPNTISNMDGDNFELMVHWELLSHDEDAVVQVELNDVYGYQVYAPITSSAASEDNPNSSDTK